MTSIQYKRPNVKNLESDTLKMYDHKMPKQRVNLDEVTAAAIAVIDRASLDALTLAAVATDLGMRPSALYTYFDSLDALRHAVAVRATMNLTDDLKDAAIGQSGDNALVALAYAYRSFANDHPGQYASTLLPPTQPGDQLAQAADSLHDVFARVISGYGHTGEAAVHAARAARAAIHGFVAIEAGRGFSTSTNHDDTFTHLIGTVIAGLR